MEGAYVLSKVSLGGSSMNYSSKMFSSGQEGGGGGWGGVGLSAEPAVLPQEWRFSKGKGAPPVGGGKKELGCEKAVFLTSDD